MRRPIARTARGAKILTAVAAGAIAFTVATGCENSAPPSNDQEQEQDGGNQPGGDQQDREQPDQQQPGGGQQDGDQDND
jgi:hypothetical protein